MRTTLLTSVKEKSTAVVTATFTDEDDNPVTPSSITYTLTDNAGTIINSRNAVEVTPANAVNIVVSGNDLAISDGFTGTEEERIVTIEAVYDSNYGNNLPLKDSVTIWIDNLVAIS